MKNASRIFLVILLLPLMQVANAAVGPDELIKQTSEKVLNILTSNKEEFEKNPGRVDQLINDVILPHLDFKAMSKLALGKNWRKASKDQREKFVEAFKTMLIRTYSKSLTEYTNHKIDFLPYRSPAEGKTVPIT